MQPIKHKIIKEYNKLVRNLNLGKISDYEHILQMISFTEIGSTTSNPELIQSYYFNK